MAIELLVFFQHNEVKYRIIAVNMLTYQTALSNFVYSLIFTYLCSTTSLKSNCRQFIDTKLITLIYKQMCMKQIMPGRIRNF